MGLQEEMLNDLRKKKVPVTVYTRNGVQMTGQIVGFDTYTLFLLNRGKVQCVMKHTVTTVSAKK